MVRVRVIIVNYNAGDLLRECVDGLEQQTCQDFETVIVDNASEDGSLSAVEGRDGVTIIRLRANTGFAAANNRGAEGAGCEWLAFLNPDAVPEPDWIQALLDGANTYARADMFGSTQIDARDSGRLDGVGDGFFAFGLPWRGGFGHPVAALPGDGEPFGPCAAAALYRRSLFETLGGFDDSFFCYYEDVDLAFRARLLGARCVQISNARVHHYGSAITGRHSAFSHFHSSRNRIWLFVKNMPGALYWLLLPGFVAMVLALLMWGTLRGHGGPVFRGILAGLAGLQRVTALRRDIQGQRIVPIRDIVKQLCWSPFKVLRRDPCLRPIPEAVRHAVTR